MQRAVDSRNGAIGLAKMRPHFKKTLFDVIPTISVGSVQQSISAGLSRAALP